MLKWEGWVHVRTHSGPRAGAELSPEPAPEQPRDPPGSPEPPPLLARPPQPHAPRPQAAVP